MRKILVGKIRKFAIPLTIFLIVLGGWLFFAVYPKLLPDYAAEVAKPLKTAIMQSGVTRTCSYGDTGHGPDNRTPWHTAYFQLPMTRDKAVDTVKRIFTQSGYTLVHATLQDRGPISVADRYVENHYYDVTSQASPYKELQQGPVKVTVSFANDGNKNLYCGAEIFTGLKYEEFESGKDQTLVNLNITLPEFK